MPRTLDTEVLIVGGGPAGATLAGCLARLGHRVALCDDGRRQHPVPFETLLPAARHALERARMREPIESLGSAPPITRFAIWGSDEPVPQEADTDGEAGVRIRRGAFEQGLRDWARSLGATVFEGCRVEGPLPGGSSDDGRGEVSVRTDEGPSRIRFEVAVSAAGRRPSDKLVRTEVVASAPETASLGIDAGLPDLPHADHEVVEATADGWHWWMPLDDDRASLTVFVDADEMQAIGTKALLDRCLRNSRGPARAFAGLQPERAARATSRLLRPLDAVVLIGDACSTIDPLSSQGTEKAIASGENAAAIVATMLVRPELRSLAIETQWRWERGLWLGHRRATERFHEIERRFEDQPFWRKRRPPAQEVDSSRPPRRLQTAKTVQRRPMLVRRGDRYEPDEGFALANGDPLDEPVSQIGPVPIAPILAAFDAPVSPAEGLRRAAGDPRIYVQSQRATIEAIGLLHQRGLLIEVAEPSSPAGSR